MFAFQSGNVRVDRVEELYGPSFKASALFKGFDPALLARYPELVDEWGYDPETTRPLGSVHTFVVRHRGKTILVDTCVGNGRSRRPEFPGFDDLDTPFLARMAEAGVEPDAVDYVFCTHLHVDHVGWNTRRRDDRWVPTFPRARYIIGSGEFQHWQPDGAGTRFQSLGARVMEDSVSPVVEAGLVDFVVPGDEILPGLTIGSVPGHTACQLSLTIDTGDRPIMFVADAFHQPVQIMCPELSTTMCEDPDRSTRTRRHLLEESAASGAILVPSHFGRPYACTVTRNGGGYGISRPE